MKTAIKGRDLPENGPGEPVALYRLTPALRYVPCYLEEGEEPLMHTTEYVVASCASAFMNEPETLIFPGREDGYRTSHIEIGGYRGGMDPAEALRTIGYELEETP